MEPNLTKNNKTDQDAHSAALKKNTLNSEILEIWNPENNNNEKYLILNS